MFICDGCLRKHYTNEPSLAKSKGRCEICGETKVCSDIPSPWLEQRPKKKAKKGKAQ